MRATLPLEALAAHGLPQRALEVWQAGGVSQLLPLQSLAVAEYGVLQGRSAIVFAPTSSGKTLIAELAALRHLEARRRVIYLVPTKALAEERGEAFRSRFGALGARVAVATREHPEADEAVARGAWDVMVAIYEKVRSYLVQRPSLLAEVGLCVADEMQLLGELGRGDSVELILTKMARAPHRTVQFLGLSAVMGDAERIGAWLGCEVLTWRGRPVELREGVLCAEDGVFRYHLVNADADGEEPLLGEGLESSDPFESDPSTAMLTLAAQLATARGESVLLFAPTKRLTREWAAWLAERVALPPAEGALEHLACMEPCQGREALAHLLRSGVAYHNADLPLALRGAVEQAYDTGEVRLLVSTSTLAQGVNLSGRNVIVSPHQVETDRWTGTPVAVALSRARFHNAGGRAGRLGREAEFGRAILVASTRAEAERLWRHHIAQPPEPLRPGLEGVDLAPIVLDLVASGVARREGEVEKFLCATHTGLTRWQHLPPSGWEDLWLGALERLERGQLVARGDDGALTATGLGHETARAGITPSTARHFALWLAEIEAEPHPLEALWCACRSPDATAAMAPLRPAERRGRGLLDQLMNSLGTPTHPRCRSWLAPEGGVTQDDLSAAKRALLMGAWISDEPTEEIERRLGMQAGAIESLAGHISWLLETLANVASSLGHPDARAAAWRGLARRLPGGLPEGAGSWAAVHVRGLSRSHLRALVREGFGGPADVRCLAVDDLERALPRPLAESLLRTVNSGQSPPPPPRPAVPDPESPADSIPRIDVETGTVQWLGCETRLTPKPISLLALLASRAPEAVGYREIEDTVWPAGEAAERQQISAHLRRIIHTLSAIDADRAASLFEVRAGQGIRMRVI
ncbi:DEAD/DEAH box helicase [Candidatus Sumerlaeota bacterium]|nr:DEAD/DEAH box helicase [Candidatus Sumerlaeota bacterium]